MFINEYGNRNDPTVILLAPMMISGSDLYGQMSQFFQGSYHIIAPDQGGHGRAGAYISADEEYRTMKSFLLETCCTNIELVYGASMGVAVAYRLFMDAGHEILPDPDKDYHSRKYRRMCYTVYKIMCATVIGKICASDHALNATEEMSALNEGLKKFFEAHHADCPTYRKLEKDAKRYL